MAAALNKERPCGIFAPAGWPDLFLPGGPPDGGEKFSIEICLAMARLLVYPVIPAIEFFG
ncbi:MAG: hypothetical protein P8Y60_14020 [Calditrichota bacterium]